MSMVGSAFANDKVCRVPTPQQSAIWFGGHYSDQGCPRLCRRDKGLNYICWYYCYYTLLEPASSYRYIFLALPVVTSVPTSPYRTPANMSRTKSVDEHVEGLDKAQHGVQPALPESLVGLSDRELSRLGVEATLKLDLIVVPVMTILYILNYLGKATSSSELFPDANEHNRQAKYRSGELGRHRRRSRSFGHTIQHDRQHSIRWLQ